MAETHSGRFLALDSWRGACAVLVAIHNFGTLSLRWHFADAPFPSHSSLFVDFFFVLGGFVITHAYIDKLNSFQLSANSYCAGLAVCGHCMPHYLWHFFAAIPWNSLSIVWFICRSRFQPCKTPD
jgi:hypothetical protein